MATPNTTRWIGVGLLGLPLYGVMTFFSSLDPQPDPNTDYEAFSRFVTTDSYLLKHLFLSDLSIIFVIFGIFALGAYLTRSPAGRMGLWAMVIAVIGQALFLLIGGVSTFATPQEWQAYLEGIEEYRQLPTNLAVTAQTATLGVSVLLQFVGNVLLGVAVWRSGILPKWAGALWAAAPVLMYVFSSWSGSRYRLRIRLAAQGGADIRSGIVSRSAKPRDARRDRPDSQLTRRRGVCES